MRRKLFLNITSYSHYLLDIRYSAQRAFVFLILEQHIPATKRLLHFIVLLAAKSQQCPLGEQRSLYIQHGVLLYFFVLEQHISATNDYCISLYYQHQEPVVLWACRAPKENGVPYICSFIQLLIHLSNMRAAHRMYQLNIIQMYEQHTKQINQIFIKCTSSVQNVFNFEQFLQLDINGFIKSKKSEKRKTCQQIQQIQQQQIWQIQQQQIQHFFVLLAA